MSAMMQRMVRAARLDATLYEEVEADPGAFGQAMTVVLLSSLAGGLAGYPTAGLPGLIGAAIGSLIGWYIWAFLTYFIGTRLFPSPGTEADLGQLLRTIGFASAPGLLRILGVIGPLAQVTVIVASIWMLAAMIVAVRQALDYTSTWRAVGVCVVGWVVQGVVLGLMLAFLASRMSGGPQY